MTDIKKDTTDLTRCYGLMIFGMPATFLPLAFWSVLGLACLLGGTVWAYVLNRRENASELVINHSRWMIRTFWISGLFALIAILMAAATISGNVNMAAQAQLQALTASGELPSQEQVDAFVTQFRNDNAALLMWASIGYLSIPIIYSVIRYAHGLKMLRAGKTMPNVKTWSV